MKYEVRYNNSNGREFANVTFENGATVSYELIKSTPKTVKEAFRNEVSYTYRQCGGRVPESMRLVFDSWKGSVGFTEVLENNLSGKFEHKAFGQCEVIDRNDKFTKIKVLETGETKMMFTQVLLLNVK